MRGNGSGNVEAGESDTGYKVGPWQKLNPKLNGPPATLAEGGGEAELAAAARTCGAWA